MSGGEERRGDATKADKPAAAFPRQYIGARLNESADSRPKAQNRERSQASALAVVWFGLVWYGQRQIDGLRYHTTDE
jgi:hypothetical protein